MVDSEERKLGSFLDKLREKKQTKVQQEQATQAIRIYYQLLQARERGSVARLSQEVGTPAKTLSPTDSDFVSPAIVSGTSQQANGDAGEATTEPYQPSIATPREVRRPVVMPAVQTSRPLAQGLTVRW